MLLQRDGWQNQAAHLSLTHSAVGTAATAVVEQIGWRRPPPQMSYATMIAADIESTPVPINIDYANDLEAMRARQIELQEQIARKTAAARIIDAHMKTVVAEAASAQDRVAELEIELGANREALARQENENCSLQSSLDLMVGENARLSRRLLEECAACDTVSSRLERLNVALTATDAERDKLLAAAAEAEKKRQSESGDLESRLKAAVLRADAAEKLLAEVQQSLLMRTEEQTAAERKAVGATLARNLMENELKSLQTALQAKEREVLDLQQLRSKLMVGLNTLLHNCKTREAALAAAKERIGLLSERLASVESDFMKRQAKIEQLKVLPDSDFTRRGAAAETRIRAHATAAEPKRTPWDHVGIQERPPERSSPHSAATLLAETVTF